MSENTLLQNPVIPPAPKAFTHKDIVNAAWEYLSKRCNVVLPEFFCWNGELADVIGFKGDISTLIECKISRADFIKDRAKPFRINQAKGMGDRRYYCCPKGLIKKEELPEKWGLLYVYPSGLVREIKDAGRLEKNLNAEFHLLYYYARRANYAGVHQRIIEYRGFDK